MNDPSLALDAFDRTLEHPETLMNAYALLNRIRLTSSDSVVDAADQGQQCYGYPPFTVIRQ